MDDRVFQNTTLTAHTLVGGKIKKLSAVDFSSDFGGDEENLAITAHGNVNSVGDYTAKGIAEKLVHPTTGLQEPTHSVFFQSCYAAVPGQDAEVAATEPTSVVSTVRSALVKRAAAAGWEAVPTVTGSYGPQIVTRVPKDERGEEFEISKAVVAPEHRPMAGKIQKALIVLLGDVKQKVRLDFRRDGLNFVEQAKKDEAVVQKFKLIFIDLVRGEPGKVESNILEALRNQLKKSYGSNQLDLILKTGLDMRPGQETLALSGTEDLEAEQGLRTSIQQVLNTILNSSKGTAFWKKQTLNSKSSSMPSGITSMRGKIGSNLNATIKVGAGKWSSNKPWNRSQATHDLYKLLQDYARVGGPKSAKVLEDLESFRDLHKLA